jgi:hypothetical protein
MMDDAYYSASRDVPCRIEPEVLSSHYVKLKPSHSRNGSPPLHMTDWCILKFGNLHRTCKGPEIICSEMLENYVIRNKNFDVYIPLHIVGLPHYRGSGLVRRCTVQVAIVRRRPLTLILLTWRIWWAPNEASKWQMGFNSAFKGLKKWVTDDRKQRKIEPSPESVE